MSKKYKNIDTLSKKYLKENPSVKKALETFNLSSEEYKKALSSISTRPATISFKSTN